MQPGSECKDGSLNIPYRRHGGAVPPWQCNQESQHQDPDCSAHDEVAHQGKEALRIVSTYVVP